MRNTKPPEQAELDSWFVFWQASGRNYNATAKHFKKNRSTIKRNGDKHGWIKKADQIDRDKVKAISKKAISDLEMVSDIQLKVVEKIKKNLKGNPLFSVSISDLALLTRLKLEIQGNLPASNTGGPNIHADVINIVQNLSESEKEQLDKSVASILTDPGWCKNTRF